MTDVLSIGPNDYLLFETDKMISPERMDGIRDELAEVFGIRRDQIVILANLHVRVLRKVPK